MIYLDHNASSPLLPAAAEAMAVARSDGDYNPASSHAAGRAARRRLETARRRVAELLGASDHDANIVFVSGATEGNNLALLGLAATRHGRITASGMEHASVIGPLTQLAAAGRDVVIAPTEASGDVDAAAFVDLLDDSTALACCTAASGETGALVELAPIAEACRARQIPLIVDASQAAGRTELEFSRLGATALIVSSHKLGGPRGVGAVALAADAKLQPLCFGGMQQEGLRPGTECPVLASGFAASLAYWVEGGEALREKLSAVRDRFEAELAEQVPEIVVHAAGCDRLPQTSCIQFLDVDGQRLQIALDAAGVACSLGTACASGSPEPSPTLLAMGVSPEAAMQSLRFSFGPCAEVAEAIAAAERISNVCKRLRSSSGV